jgi:oligoendopeptidase F
MTTLRKDVSKKDRWNVESLYPSIKVWEEELKKFIKAKTPPFFKEIGKLQGKLGKSAKQLKELFDLYFQTERKLRKLYTYAKLRHDEDITDETYKKAADTISTIYHIFAQETSWIEPEILAIDAKEFKKFVADKNLAEYRFFLENLSRLRPHTLDAAQERLIALADQALQAPHRAFSAISDADFKFGTIVDSKGVKKELTHGSYGVYMRDHDRELRKNAFHTMLNKYGNYENSITELLQGQLQKHYFQARAKNYPTCLDAALYPKHIDTTVYTALIKAVHDNIGALHKYMKLRKKVLGLKELHLYDTYVPIVDSYDKKFSYDEAEELVIKSVKPLGDEYQSLLKKGLLTDRWVDRFENLNKRSGAYSSGCYDSSPYILMNFKGILRDVFTLAHEAGHSMHSLFSRKTQPYHYSDYTIFVAEVASTFNEELLMKELLNNAKTKQQKAFLINEKLEDIRATLFRQTMFAEFELFLHTAVEKRIPITPALLKQEYQRLNHFYFGKDVTIDPEIALEWARIPHFYYGFYVYQYATGISAAIALAEKVTTGGKKERDAYLNFLKSGSSDYPLNELQKAGVDMRTTEPVERAIQKFSKLTDELQKLLSK